MLKLFLSKTFPALIIRKPDFEEGCTRLAELVERNDGTEQLTFPEYEAGVTGRIARSFRTAFFSVVFLSVEETTVPWGLSSEISFLSPEPPETQERNKDIMSMIPFMTSIRANI